MDRLASGPRRVSESDLVWARVLEVGRMWNSTKEGVIERMAQGRGPDPITLFEIKRHPFFFLRPGRRAVLGRARSAQ